MFKSTSSSRRGKRIDYTILAIVSILVLAGLIFLASATGQPKEVLKDQLLKGVLPGFVLFLLASFFPYQKLKPFAFYFLILNILLLCVLFIPGLGLAQSSGGAARWIKVGPIGFQPSELLKITLVLYLAAWLSNSKMERAKSLTKGTIPFTVICLIIAGLLYFQPATSMILILILSGGVMYFLSGAPWKHITFMSLGAGVICALAVLFFLSNPDSHRARRIKTFLNPQEDTLNTGYQANQARIAIGSGGLFGAGYGRDSARVSVPKADNDLIFSVIAQQTGFAGAGFVVILFAILVARLFWLARNIRDRFGGMILGGFASIMALQSFFHMAANSGMIPLTGLPLPFISLGGTSMIVSLIMMGIAVNISKYSN